MKLLVVTQVLDEEDPVLGFFCRWVTELADRAESIVVVCLKEGKHTLPENVAVHSLGKEEGAQPAFVYAVRFKYLAWKLRRQYDRVLVHMNQEYLLIAGPMWKVLGKPVYLWRNHYAGSFLTDVAAAFAKNVFCTSRHSYTAKYRKTMLMPVGVDLENFPMGTIERQPRSILFLARIAPSKRADMFIDALGRLIGRGISFIASVYGSPLPEDERYYESIKARAEDAGLHSRVAFHPGVTHRETAALYQSHEIFVNCSPSGMFDKTLFEAAASGCLVIAASDDFRTLAGQSAYAADDELLAKVLEKKLALSAEEKEMRRKELRELAEDHSLPALADALIRAIQ